MLFVSIEIERKATLGKLKTKKKQQQQHQRHTHPIRIHTHNIYWNRENTETGFIPNTCLIHTILNKHRTNIHLDMYASVHATFDHITHVKEQQKPFNGMEYISIHFYCLVFLLFSFFTMHVRDDELYGPNCTL